MSLFFNLKYAIRSFLLIVSFAPRFVKDSDVTVCALEVLLHYATSGDEKALIDAQVRENEKQMQ